ncbi:ribonuclease H-like domain-containing protein [Tanacetum coccineum]
MLKSLDVIMGQRLRNHAMNEFCAKKGIKREFSVARTPQQNDAVNTACYVLNRVLVTKPQNKTPYELLIAGNSFVYDPNPNSFNDPLNFFNHPPQPQTYSCELCGNNSHYGYDCLPRVPLVYEQEPSYNQNFGDNYYPQNSPSFSQQYIYCVHCGSPHENFQCQPWHQNYVEPNPSNSYGFDQTPQNSIDHQPQSIQEDLNQQRMNDVLKAMHSLVEKLRQQEQAANLSTHTPEPSRRFNFIYDDNEDDDDDNDDEESTIPLNEIISQNSPSIAITPVYRLWEPKDFSNIGLSILSHYS